MAWRAVWRADDKSSRRLPKWLAVRGCNTRVSGVRTQRPLSKKKCVCPVTSLTLTRYAARQSPSWSSQSGVWLFTDLANNSFNVRLKRSVRPILWGWTGVVVRCPTPSCFKYVRQAVALNSCPLSVIRTSDVLWRGTTGIAHACQTLAFVLSFRGNASAHPVQ